MLHKKLTIFLVILAHIGSKDGHSRINSLSQMHCLIILFLNCSHVIWPALTLMGITYGSSFATKLIFNSEYICDADICQEYYVY